MQMKALKINGINLPISEDWQVPPNVKSYAGKGGLLDVRIMAHSVPIDQERLKLAKQQLSSQEGLVELLMIQGVSCLCCRYKQKDCLLLTFSFGFSLENEIV